MVWNIIFLTFHILGIIIPAGSYFSEGLKPPTRAINSIYQLACTLLKMPLSINFRRPMNHHNPITRILNTPIVWFLKYVDMSLLNHGFVWVCLIRRWDYDFSNTTQKRTAPPERDLFFHGDTTSEFMGLVVVNYQEWLIGSWLMDLLKY